MQDVETSCARQQPAGGFGSTVRRSLRTQCAQDQNAIYDLSDILIDGNQAFGVQLAEGNMQRPLVLA